MSDLRFEGICTQVATQKNKKCILVQERVLQCPKVNASHSHNNGLS